MLRSYLPHNTLVVRRSAAGLGLFAKQPIRVWQKIIEYTWEKVPTSVADRRGWKYLFTVNSRYTIIGTGHHNRARYINHSCLPNAEPREMRWRIVIYAIRPILAWEEITYNYWKDYFTRIIKPAGCRCKKCFVKK
jgi:SET domain-containing protein